MTAGREDARHAFVDRMGDLGAGSGMPRMAARTFSHLLSLDDAAATAADLAEALDVSPAAISGAARYLESVGLVRRTRERGSRRDLFVLQEEVWSDYVARSLDLLRVWGEVLVEGSQAVPDGAARRRLTENAAFFDYLADELDDSITRWQAGLGTGRVPPGTREQGAPA
ncbi:MarR family transcriptional regulator [Arsenicicoccus dermatophilus]|uniref:MarR family transcriptional regulator n=1 Tax=Arsenicicoccus dermatophilus TaxID=1076331 RepID=UPI001F4CA4C5|nr:MarR family transcriptional regulator [Arsenicicoccus dermatophilus]MCH8611504.1 MarR family transcriptional regulator [Arsenicicoccus dermatophilus]